MATSIRQTHTQTETDMLSELATVHHCAWDHAKNTSLVKKSWRKREPLRARQRDAHMEKETEIKHKRERKRHRTEKTEK